MTPDNFDGDRSKGHAFLTSCELYLSLTGLDYPDEQSRIHWALSFFKSGRAATFAERTVRQEMRTGVMAFADWMDFTSEFMSTFCPENEATSALMHLKSDRYFQGQRNVEAYIDEFKDLINIFGYTDPIAIVLKIPPRPECDDARQDCRVGDRLTTRQRPPRLVCGRLSIRPQSAGQRGIQLRLPTSYSAVDDALVRQLYSCAHSVLVLPSGHLVDLVPCIHTRPYEAISPDCTSSQSQECGRHQGTTPCRTDLLLMWPNWPHQSGLRPPSRYSPHDAG
jgi:hypothetical protein